MTPASQYVALAVVLFCIAQLTIAAWMIAQNSRLRRVAKYERIRGEFAVARNKLIWLAAQGHVKPDSRTFFMLYQIQSTMMRHFHAYPVFSSALWSHFLDGNVKSKDTKLDSEAQHWNDETKAVATATADALRHVWLGCMPFGMGAKVAMRLSGRVAQSVGRAVAKLLPGLRDIRETEKFIRTRLA